ncbi:hypothetical protein PQX77_010187 [Marasmius sp. AFHP31]|nr:hypothetical protein PQX77_010187 [Marasmius sp. AFHP31]
MEDDSEAYASLSAQVQGKIDKAFYDALGYNTGQRRKGNQRHTRSRATKKGKVDSGGGFLIDNDNQQHSLGGGGGGFISDGVPEPAAAGGGGFIVDDEEDRHEVLDNNQEKPEFIPLSTIPDALQLLGLDPGDAQVMGVFRRAASDWGDVQGDGSTTANRDTEEGLVSLKDWRAVCGVLLEGADIPESVEPPDIGEDDSDGPPSDSYEPEDDSDEYLEEQDISHQRRRPRGTTAKMTADFDLSSLSGDDEDEDVPSARRLTPRQRQTCLQAFALFFPDASPEDLPKQRLRITDIQRVAGLLKEKLKADEASLCFFMVDMLETFSTAPDKSMSLEDFEKMMIRAKLA